MGGLGNNEVKEIALERLVTELDMIQNIAAVSSRFQSLPAWRSSASRVILVCFTGAVSSAMLSSILAMMSWSTSWWYRMFIEKQQRYVQKCACNKQRVRTQRKKPYYRRDSRQTKITLQTQYTLQSHMDVTKASGNGRTNTNSLFIFLLLLKTNSRIF